MSWDSARGNTIFKLRARQRNDKGETVMRCEAKTATYWLLEKKDPETGKISMFVKFLAKDI